MEACGPHRGYLDGSNMDFYCPMQREEVHEEGLCELFACRLEASGQGLLERLAVEEGCNDLDDPDESHGPAWDSRDYGSQVPHAKLPRRSDHKAE